MHGWVTRVLVLVYAVAWFGIVIPGHQRGMITYPSSGDSISAAQLPPCHQKKQAPDAPAAPSKSGPCVICMMAAMVVPPPAVDQVPQLSLRGPLEAARAEDAFAPNIPLPSSERGPPVV
jgi:hypothetical protein